MLQAHLSLSQNECWLIDQKTYYHLSKNPVFHQAAYASMTAGTVFRGMYVMEAQLRPALRKRSQDPSHADMLMKQMWMMAATGEQIQYVTMNANGPYPNVTDLRDN